MSKKEVNEKQAAFQLINMKGIGNQSFLKLVECAGSAQRALDLSEGELKEILGQKMVMDFLRGREYCLWKKI